MSAENTQDKAPKSLETRLGLVMYGGVSLAIYINGVAQEFFNAVRGRGVYKLVKALTDSDIVVDIISGTSAGGINGIMLAYALCNDKEFASSARLWRNDGDIRRLLRSPHGGAESSWSLLNSEGFYQKQLEAAYRGMEEITDDVEKGEALSKFPELDLFVTGTDVDGRRFTQFDDAGHPIDVKDHRAVFLLKHRAGRKEPFRPGGEGNRPPGVEKLDEEDIYRALAKLSRITSCFPAAFSPVTVTNPGSGGDKADALLRWWGGLGRESVFLDGGLIDNKPFTYTLKEIFYRGAVRRVNRRLFYVEPDPEHWEEIASATQPNFAQAITASLIGIPGYESISDDLRLLATHNSRLERYNRLVQSLHDRGDIEPTSGQAEMLYKRSRLIGLSERVMRGIMRTEGRDELLDRETRAAAAELITGFERLVAEPRGDGAAQPGPEQAARVRQLDAEFLVRMQLAQAEADDEKRNEATAKAASDYVAERRKAECELRPKTRADKILADYDVEFRLRRLFHTVYFIMKQLADPAELEKKGKILILVEDKSGKKVPTNVSRPAQYEKVWRFLNKQIELLDIVRTSAEKVIDDSDFEWKNRETQEVWEDAQAVLNYFFDARTDAAEKLPMALHGSTMSGGGEQLSSFAKTNFNGALCELRDRVIKATKPAGEKLPDFHYVEAAPGGRRRLVFDPSRKFESILPLIDSEEARMLRGLLPSADDPVRKVYEGFPMLDARLYPIDLIAELHEKDIIKTVRISPFDARRGFSNKGLSDKVSGDALYHFGGFFKRSWRSNDILWGRLDGLCQLVETLISRERLDEVMADAQQLKRVRESLYEADESGAKLRLRAELSPKVLFPYAGGLMWKSWETWLRNFVLGGDDAVNPDGSAAAQELRQEVRKKAIQPDVLKETVELLIEAAQLEIIKDDVPKVITDALEEQVVWNQFRIPRNGEQKEGEADGRRARRDGDGSREEDSGEEKEPGEEGGDPFVFSPPPADLDAFVGVFAADENRVSKWVASMKPKEGDPERRPLESRLGGFFRHNYTVGAEALLKDVPVPVLLEILSVSLLVLRNCVLEIFGDRGERIKHHPLYLLAVDYPLRAFYLLVRFLRRAPRWERQVTVVLGVVSGLLLAVSLWRGTDIFMTKEGFDIPSFVIFIAAPLLALYLIFFYFRNENYLRHQRKPSPARAAKGKKGKKGKSDKLAGSVTWKRKLLRVVPLLVRAVLAFAPVAVIGYLLWDFVTVTKEGKAAAEYTLGVHPYVLIAACLLALVGPFAARVFTLNLLDFVDLLSNGRWRNKVRGDALRDSLESYFSAEEIHEIGKSLLVSTPFKWERVKALLRERTEAEKGPLAQRIESANEEDKAALQAGIKELEEGLGKRFETLEKQFGSYKFIKWGNLRSFTERQQKREDLNAAERAAWEADLRYLSRKLRIPTAPDGEQWPFVGAARPDTPPPPPWRRVGPFRDATLPPRSEAERRERLADEIIRFADDRDSLARLAARMRFINPEALYGE